MFTQCEISQFRPAVKRRGAYDGGNRKLGARFRVKGFRKFAESDESAPTVQLQRIRMFLAVISYRKRNFRVMGISRAPLRSGPLGRDAYAQLPRWVGKANVSRMLLKPLYGLSTACKGRHKTIRNLLANECGGKATSLDKSVFSRAQKIDYDSGV